MLGLYGFIRFRITRYGGKSPRMMLPLYCSLTSSRVRNLRQWRYLRQSEGNILNIDLFICMCGNCEWPALFIIANSIELDANEIGTIAKTEKIAVVLSMRVSELHSLFFWNFSLGLRHHFSFLLADELMIVLTRSRQKCDCSYLHLWLSRILFILLLFAPSGPTNRHFFGFMVYCDKIVVAPGSSWWVLFSLRVVYGRRTFWYEVLWHWDFRFLDMVFVPVAMLNCNNQMRYQKTKTKSKQPRTEQCWKVEATQHIARKYPCILDKHSSGGDTSSSYSVCQQGVLVAPIHDQLLLVPCSILTMAISLD